MIFRLLTAQWAATIYVGGVSFALSVLIARQTGPSNFGEYSVALAAGAVLAIFLDGGWRNLLTRERTSPSVRLQAVATHLPSMALGHSLVMFFAASVLAIILIHERLSLALATIACFWSITLTQFVSAVLRGDGRIGVDAGWHVVHRSVSALCIGIAVISGFESPWQILTAWAVGLFLANMLSPFGMRNRPVILISRDLYRITLPLLWIDLATAVYFRSDVLVMQVLGLDGDHIGQYAAAYRLIEVVILITNPVAILIFRRLRRMSLEHYVIGKELLRTTAYAVLLGVACALSVTFLAEQVVRLTYGVHYQETAVLLSVLALAVAFILPNAVLTQAALALELERPYAWAATVAAVFNLALNWLLIGRFGPLAAAWTTVFTEGILMFILAFALIRRLEQSRHWRKSSLGKSEV